MVDYSYIHTYRYWCCWITQRIYIRIGNIITQYLYPIISRRYRGNKGRRPYRSKRIRILSASALYIKHFYYSCCITGYIRTYRYCTCDRCQLFHFCISTAPSTTTLCYFYIIDLARWHRKGWYIITISTCCHRYRTIIYLVARTFSPWCTGKLKQLPIDRKRTWFIADLTLNGDIYISLSCTPTSWRYCKSYLYRWCGRTTIEVAFCLCCTTRCITYIELIRPSWC